MTESTLPGAAASEALSLFRKRVRRDKRHRYSVRCADGAWRPAPSVSAVLGNLEKRALIGWAARMQHDADIEAAFRIHDKYQRRFPKWQYEAVFQAEVGSVLAHEATTRKAADNGTAVHAAIEAYLLGSDAPDRGLSEHPRAGFEIWREWWQTAGLTALAIECPVAYFENGEPVYAGTFDLLAIREDGTLVLIDFKTGSIGYQEQRLQSVAYRAAARQMGVTGEVAGLLVKVPRCADGRVETYEVKDDLDEAFACFRALNTVHAWRARK
jgi:hypothetical protein